MVVLQIYHIRSVCEFSSNTNINIRHIFILLLSFFYKLALQIYRKLKVMVAYNQLTLIISYKTPQKPSKALSKT